MHTVYVKRALVAGWALALAIVAITTDVTRFSNWFVLAAVGVAVTMVVLRLWREPAPSTSEQIQDALR
jgi:hypothetical protein